MTSASRIRVLPEKLANQIAAGEVIQRPASALKELIENSLDAGARSIRIDLESGGTRRIRVRDDGYGMGRDDAILAFERHATSKIGSEYDLNRVETLGFRGEALPSIAAVSKIALTTRVHGASLGTEVRIQGGKLLRVIEMGAPEGTDIDIRSLFFNVPARRKFLKTKTTELARCVEVAQRAAMAHHETSFTLQNGGRSLISLEAVPGRLQRAAGLLGKDALPHLMKLVGEESAHLHLSGWVGAPTLTRSTRDGQFFFVNERPVRDRLLVHAISEAYRSFLPHGRHPVFAVFLNVPPEEVDVNVHPSKEEIRFRKGSLIHESLRNAVAKVLGSPPRRPRLIVRKPNGLDLLHSGSDIPRSGNFRKDKAPSLLGGGGYIPPISRGLEGQTREFSSEVPSSAQRYFTGEKTSALFGVRELDALESLPSGALPLDRVLVPPDPSNPVLLSECRYLGQWAGCFLLFESDQGLVFVDQHAAHERVLYNRFRDQFRKGKVERQATLVPPILRLRPEEALRVDEHQDTLNRSGFELEAEGPGEFLINAVPALMVERDPVGAVRRVIERLGELDSPMSFPDLIDSIIAGMSCKGAVKASQSLHPEEVASLVRDIDKTPGKWTCPHGRPIMLMLTVGPVRRRFLR